MKPYILLTYFFKKRVASPKDIMHIKSSSLLHHTHIHTLFLSQNSSKISPNPKDYCLPLFSFLKFA
jgi:hypothetical protein